MSTCIVVSDLWLPDNITRLSQKRDGFEREFLQRQHQVQEELMLRERDREMEKSKFRTEVNTKYEQKLESLREFQSALQQQFADYEMSLRNRYEKVVINLKTGTVLILPRRQCLKTQQQSNNKRKTCTPTKSNCEISLIG